MQNGGAIPPLCSMIPTLEWPYTQIQMYNLSLQFYQRLPLYQKQVLRNNTRKELSQSFPRLAVVASRKLD